MSPAEQSRIFLGILVRLRVSLNEFVSLAGFHREQARRIRSGEIGWRSGPFTEQVAAALGTDEATLKAILRGTPLHETFLLDARNEIERRRVLAAQRAAFDKRIVTTVRQLERETERPAATGLVPYAKAALFDALGPAATDAQIRASVEAIQRVLLEVDVRVTDAVQQVTRAHS